MNSLLQHSLHHAILFTCIQEFKYIWLPVNCVSNTHFLQIKQFADNPFLNTAKVDRKLAKTAPLLFGLDLKYEIYEVYITYLVMLLIQKVL